ncbi:hypothetical protein IPJ72_03445 [Candidatus Peregrinibacteria bacterium]|nr:MAG: hypothetical protein IPJ72_03445 [Candidatus Peregrinibacteria bacterium]
MTKRFIRFQKYIERLKQIYIHSICSFYVYEAIQESKAQNILGEEKAEENAKTMGNYKGLFSTLEYGLKIHSLMELAKIFDNAEGSLHINKLINFAKSNTKHLSSNDFKEANQEREFIDELTKEYEGLKKSDFEELDEMMSVNAELIEKLKVYRNQYLAHEDKKKKNINIAVEEVKKLFNIVEKILNMLSSKTNFSTTMFEQLKEECKEDTKFAVIHLKQMERYRLKKPQEDKIDEQNNSS